MLKKALILTLLTAITTVLFTACASTQPSSLSGNVPVNNDKGRVVGYQAR